MSDIPSYEQFEKDISGINPEGNLKETYQRIQQYVEEYGLKTSKNVPLTYNLIIEGYRNHIIWYSNTYGTETKYIRGKDKDKKKTLFEYLGEACYNNIYSTSKGDMTREKYLFGDFSLDYLKRLKDQFVNQFK